MSPDCIGMQGGWSPDTIGINFKTGVSRQVGTTQHLINYRKGTFVYCYERFKGKADGARETGAY